jgi:hypothetical protein
LSVLWIIRSGIPKGWHHGSNRRLAPAARSAKSSLVLRPQLSAFAKSVCRGDRSQSVTSGACPLWRVIRGFQKISAFPCNLTPNFRLYMPTTIQPQQRKE